MTAAAKTTLALLLLAGGFIAAKTLGPPDLAGRLVSGLRDDPSPDANQLRPATRDDHFAEHLAPLDAVEMPAYFSAAQRDQALPSTPAFTTPDPPPAWTSPQLTVLNESPAAREPMVDAPSRDIGLRQLNFESDLAPLPSALARQGLPPENPTPELNSQNTFEPFTSPAISPAEPPDGAELPTFPPFQEPPPVLPPAASTGWETEPNSGPTAQWASMNPDESALAAPSPYDSASESPPPAESQARARSHFVADGDSLPKLAKRYLGDAARAEEIYSANEAVLTHPDLLPLGVELRIP